MQYIIFKRTQIFVFVQIRMNFLIFCLLGLEAALVTMPRSCQFAFWNLGNDFTKLPQFCSNGQKGNVLLSLKTKEGNLNYCYTFPLDFHKKTQIKIVKIDLFHKKLKSEFECFVGPLQNFE